MAAKLSKYPKWYVWLRDARDWTLARWLLTFLAAIKLLPADAAINSTAWITRRIGMLHPRTRLARENLQLAFPEKSAGEIEKILHGVWENLGRTAAEYAFLDKIFNIDLDNPENGRFEILGTRTSKNCVTIKVRQSASLPIREIGKSCRLAPPLTV